MSPELDRQSLIDIFVTEASEALDALTKAFHPPDGTQPTPSQLQDQYVWAHKIRGASALYGYEGLALMGSLLESTLEEAPSIEASLWPKALETLQGVVGSFKAQLDVVARGGVEDLEVSAQWKSEVAELFPTLFPSTSSEPAVLAPDYLAPTLGVEVLSYFIPEANEYLQTMEAQLHRLQENAGDEEAIYRLYSMAHMLKGSAQAIGFTAVCDVAGPIENCMSAIRERQISISPDVLGGIGRAVEVIRLLVRRDVDMIPQLQHEVPDVTQALAQIRNGEQVTVPAQSVAPFVPAVQVMTVVMEDSGGFPDTKGESEGGAASTLTDEYLLPSLDAEVLSYFAPEAQEYLESLEAQLLRLEKEDHNKEVIDQLFRTAHTLKGSAYTVGFQSVGDLTHYVEDFMGAAREGRVKILPGHTDMLLRSVDVVRLLLRRDPASLGMLRQRFAATMQELKQLDQPTASPVAASPSGVARVVTSMDQESRDHEEIESAHVADGKTPDSKAVEDREVIRVSRDRLERLLNLVGELVIGRGRLEQRLHILEQLSQQVLAYKGRLVESVHSFEEKHTFTLPTAASDSAAVPAQGFAGLSDFGSLEFDKYDDFNILARRISEVTADISESMTQLSGSIRRSHEDMSHLAQLTLGMRDEIARARMVPIGTPFTRFRRATREMARATGKEVTLVTSGEHTDVDTGVVERLVDPLIHLVRNAVYHGIEPAAIRVTKGKPAAGSIYLHAAHRGNAVLIEVEDDGAGLDVEKIRAKAVERGLIRPEVARSLPESEVIKFIFMPGFSTADQIGDQAGRGVGMDVVKRVIESMNGHIDVESVRGVGTKFTLSLPLTLLIATALMVRAGNECYAIPLPAVREVTMLTPGTLQRMGERSMLHIGDEAIEAQPLQQILSRSAVTVEIGKPVVIVRTASGMIGIVVDELLGRQEIVIKPLGSLKSLNRSSFGGATIDPEGRVVLVLDPVRLMAREAQVGAAAELESNALASVDSLVPYAEVPKPKPAERLLLLIDDSLSIRKFVGRMLESAGYDVHTAVDGEEGLRMASAQNYRLIITDLEMPKLNGFEVIQGLRSREHTQETPVIVMTTRAGDKHRQMALNIGASSYIAKPVEERALIQEIERWVGKEAAVSR
ncbi:MAG: Hpt domain-containing protein [Nitrospira sp.]|nr:Hpt domain-containing protein [Nitrospira sp.]